MQGILGVSQMPPRNHNYALYRATAVRLLERRERDLKCDQLF